jgi:hypothetical protein
MSYKMKTYEYLSNIKIYIKKWVLMTMRVRFDFMKSNLQLKSILLVFIMVATSMLVIFPLSIPEVSAVTHLDSADAEDGVSPYDTDGMKNGIVMWDPNANHDMTAQNGYTIEAHMTVNIPTDVSVYFSGFSARQIDVYGTLLTNPGSLMPPIFTTFEGAGGWEGIFFRAGSKGNFQSCIIRGANAGIVFEPGSELLSPGISYSSFEDMNYYGLRMDGVLGNPSISNTNFDDSADPSARSLVDVSNGKLNMNNVLLLSHKPDYVGLRISNVTLSASDSAFNAHKQNGTMVQIEGGSNGTVFNRCSFINGAPDELYIKVNGSSVVFNNCRIRTSTGTRSVEANEDLIGIPSHVVLINPVSNGAPGSYENTFDNSSMSVSGGSSITLKWYMDVFVIDPDLNPIDNAPVWVKDRLGNPAVPDLGFTDEDGVARGFMITELIKYESSITGFNNFNVSALNNSMMGYAEPLMNYSRVVTVVVPFSLIPNTPPKVTWLTTPVGLQSGYIPFDFILEDPNPADHGNLSILVDFSIDGVSWDPAISAPGSDLTRLNNNTLYTYIWDSAQSLGNNYFPTIYIRITPKDKAGNGTPSQTGSFAVENKPPSITYISTPSGVQSGLITIDFKLEDLNPAYNGKMSVTVEYSLDGISWNAASAGPGSEVSGLFNNTMHQFVWDSKNDIPNSHETTVYIRIIPKDPGGEGPSDQTGAFTVDNKAPQLLTFPTVTISDTTALIEWDVDEPADAKVNFGPHFSGPPGDLTFQTAGSTGSTQQSVTLTGLTPGRYYYFIIISTDVHGNQFKSSIDTVFTFETEVHIQLYTGWNMISIPPYLLNATPDEVFTTISGEYEVVQAYYASDPADPWKHYRPDKSYGNDLTVITDIDGLWILMKNDAVLIPNHKDPTTDPMFNVSMVGLEAGWNFVGYPSVYTRSINYALAGVPYDLVQTYDAASGQWLSYDGTSGSLTQMEVGRGYWIHCTTSHNWQVAYDE